MAIYDLNKAKTSDQTNPGTAIEIQGESGLNLLLRLQQTLDAKELIEHFTKIVMSEIGIDGYSYRHPPEAMNCQMGHHNRHEIAYTLRLEDKNLGEFKFYRSKPITEAESARIEDLLSFLIHPLNNAFRYRAALRLAYTDALTGLRNRSNLTQQMQREISLARRENHPMSLIFVDIDNFKKINDLHGHFVGDQVIMCVAQRLRETLRDSDLIFRYGGEEFVIILNGSNAASSHITAERLRTAVEESTCVLKDGESITVSISLGVSELRENDDAMTLFTRTDSAMYQAKEGGRNQICVQ